jgi:hypothetical protein
LIGEDGGNKYLCDLIWSDVVIIISYESCVLRLRRLQELYRGLLFIIFCILDLVDLVLLVQNPLQHVSSITNRSNARANVLST